MWGVATGDSQLKVWIHPHWPFKWTPTTTKQINEKYKTMSVHVLFVSPLHLVFPTYLPLLNASTHHCLPEDKLLIPLITTWAATRHVFLTTPSRLPQLPTVVTCSSIQPALAIFPSLSHFPHSLTSSSRDHLRNKPLELKSLSQCLPGSTFSTIFH